MQPLTGILLKTCSVAVFVCMASLIKASAPAVPPGQAVFFRSLFAVPVIFVWLAFRGRLHLGLRTRRPGAHLWRGLVGTSAMGLGFAGLGLLPLPAATAIGYAAPVMVVILAALFLGERIRAFRMAAVLLGLAGVLVVMWPKLALGDAIDLTANTQAFGAILVLAGALCAAIAQVTVRSMVKTESTESIVFYFSVTACILALFTMPFGWTIPPVNVIAMLCIAGLLGGLGQILLTASYRFADVSVIAPFEYTSILLAVGAGYFFFDEIPTMHTLMGSALVIAAGVIIIWRERQLGLQRGKARPSMAPGDK